MVFVEGLPDRGMQLMMSIAEWAFTEPKPDDAKIERRMMYNRTMRYPERLYANFGTDLWIVKLRSSLMQIVADAKSYSSGQVKPDCVVGLHRVFALHSAIQWMRTAHVGNLYPTTQMVGNAGNCDCTCEDTRICRLFCDAQTSRYVEVAWQPFLIDLVVESSRFILAGPFVLPSQSEHLCMVNFTPN